MTTLNLIFVAVIIFLLSLCSFSNAADLDQTDYNTLSSLFSTLGISFSATVANACAVSGVQCTNPPTGDKRVNYLSLTTSKQTVVPASAFTFPELTMLIVNNLNAGNIFPYELNTAAPKCTYLKCVNCKINQVHPQANFDTLYLQVNDFQGTHYLSEVSRFKYFSSANGNFENVDWVNDLTTKLTTNTLGLTLYTSSFPDLSFYKQMGDLIIMPTSNFPGGDLANIDKIPSAIQSVWFEREAPLTNGVKLRFPLFLENFKSTHQNQINFISNRLDWVVPRKLDLTGSNIVLFRVQRGTFDLEDGSMEYPIAKTNSSCLTNLEISLGSLTTVDFNVLRKTFNNNIYGAKVQMQLPEITLYNTDRIGWAMSATVNDFPRAGESLQLGANKFFGTVPNWICNTDSNLQDNQFTGILPSCFTCFLSDGTIRNKIRGNQFSNYQDDMVSTQYPPCTTLKITDWFFAFRQSNGEGSFHIIGVDLGIRTYITMELVGTSRSIYVKPLKYNNWYYFTFPASIWDTDLLAATTIRVTFTTTTPNIVLDLDITGKWAQKVPFNSTFLQSPYPIDPNTIPSTTGSSTSAEGTSTSSTGQSTSSTSAEGTSTSSTGQSTSEGTSSSTGQSTSSTSAEGTSTSSTSQPTSTETTSNQPTSSSSSNPTTSSSSTGSGSSSPATSTGGAGSSSGITPSPSQQTTTSSTTGEANSATTLYTTFTLTLIVAIIMVSLF
ncbi:hypothetical protein CYY_006664 [Polysphondylium violaceum]|uniref:EGF-like domain-containing protein n=1 Tax=Polysphondylium violaceum TaxID=133409 RepID=A0A8J4UY42_9MYCE|nr:hypothetical protein CYY_006664 [Polysphondylium violaceum]